MVRRQKKILPRKLFSGIRTRLMSVFSMTLLLVLVSSILFITNGNNTVSQYREIIDTISCNGEIRGKMLRLVDTFKELQILSEKNFHSLISGVQYGASFFCMDFLEVLTANLRI